MLGVVRHYTGDPVNVDAVVSQARSGFVPLISAAPGYLAYTIVDGGTDGLVTVSTFTDQASADASTRLAADWVKAALASSITEPPLVTSGAVVFRTARPEVHFGYGVLRRYYFNPADVDTALSLVREGLVPHIEQAAGFASYTVVHPGDGTIVSLTAFSDKAAAEASTTQTLAWVREHLGSYHPTPPQVVAGAIKLRHSFQ